MVASAKTMDALRTIGLNKYERNLWVALLARGASTAGELSDISNVPRSRCYDVLESLADRGFVVIQQGKPLKYVAMNPREAFERAKKKINEHAIETVDKIERLKKSESMKELEKVHKDNMKIVRPEDLSGSLKGRYAMIQQIETMLKKAKKTVKLITTADGLIELAENHLPLLKKASESGVSIKIAAPVNKNTSEVAKALAKYAQVRNIDDVEHIENMLGRFFLIDGDEFLMGLTDDVKTHPTQDVSFWSQSNHAASMTMDPLFELVWHHSKPVKN
jgi:HTH-type transcriptional regulator, sugar sensing transcriptional regulator